MYNFGLSECNRVNANHKEIFNGFILYCYTAAFFFTTVFKKGNNFCDLQFASPLKKGATLKGNNLFIQES